MPINPHSPLKKLMNTQPQAGHVEWIGVRPERDAPIIQKNSVAVSFDGGLEGDRFSGGKNSKRQVTLIQAEHIVAVASMLHKKEIHPSLLRRNIVVSGVNLLALKDRTFRVGEVTLKHTGPCQPCSKMERNLGPGGYNAMRGHGGITATVIEEGTIRIGDSVAI